MVLLVLTAAFTDIRSRRIPNWLVIGGLCCGFGLNIALFRLEGLRLAALGFGLALLLYLPMFVLRGMGGGDVKLMAALGSLAGPMNWFLIFILTALFGGLIAIVLLLTTKRLQRTLSNVALILNELAHLRAPYRAHQAIDIASDRAVTLPHGVAIALGTLVFLAVLRLPAPTANRRAIDGPSPFNLPMSAESGRRAPIC